MPRSAINRTVPDLEIIKPNGGKVFSKPTVPWFVCALVVLNMVGGLFGRAAAEGFRPMPTPSTPCVRFEK